MKRLWISGIVLILDQLSKWLVTVYLTPLTSVPVLGDYFKLTYIHNPGAVFGIQFGGVWVHLLFSSVAMFAVLRMLWTTPTDDRTGSIGLALILGGAVGNLFDRLEIVLQTGAAVIDFLDFGIGTNRWYIFNVADACVTTGVGLLLLSYGISRSEPTVDDGGPGAV